MASAELQAWLEEYRLDSWAQKTAPHDFFGLETLDDLKLLSEEDIGKIIERLGMPIGEKNRFTLGLEHLRREAPIGEKNRFTMGPEILRREATAAAGPETSETEWFLVVASMAFVKCAPKEDAESVGIVKQGCWLQVERLRVRDKHGLEWVELKPLAPVEWVCRSETPVDHAFVLIDGSSLGKGLLLAGPLPGPPAAPPGAAVSEEVEDDDGEVSEEVEDDDEVDDDDGEEKQVNKDTFEAQSQNQQLLRRAVVDCLTEAAEQKAVHEKRLRDSGVVYRTLLSVLHISEDPREAEPVIKSRSCQPGEPVYATLPTWTGADGRTWVERRAMHNVVPGWLLVEGAEGPVLISEGDAKGSYARVLVDHLGCFTSVRVFETFISLDATVRVLRSRLCASTGLQAGGTILVRDPPRPADGAATAAAVPLLERVRPRDALEDGNTLRSYNFDNEEQLYLIYTRAFEEHIQHGQLLRSLEEPPSRPRQEARH